MVIKFEINDFLEVRLEHNITNIYVNGEWFNQCKYLLLNIPKQEVKQTREIDSIDEAADRYSRVLEFKSQEYDITPETEFWAHSSNLQAWADNDYDTRLLHSNLSFPLLKKLSRAGDPKAERVFKKEIIKRYNTGYEPVQELLRKEKYLDLLNNEELEQLIGETISFNCLCNNTHTLNLNYKQEKHMQNKGDYKNILYYCKELDKNVILNLRNISKWGLGFGVRPVIKREIFVQEEEFPILKHEMNHAKEHFNAWDEVEKNSEGLRELAKKIRKYYRKSIIN